MRRLGLLVGVAAATAVVMWSCVVETAGDGERKLAEARRLLERGRTCLAEHQYDQAAALFAQVRQVQPENLDAGILEVQAKVAGGQADRALDLVMRLLAANPDEPRLSFLLAGLFERRNQFAQALGALKAAQRLEEDLALIYLESARLHWRFKHHAEASAALAKAAAILPPSSPLAGPVDELSRMVAGGKS